MATTAQRLEAIFAKDGGEFPKKGKFGGVMLAEVLGDIRKERTEQAKVQAKDLILKALSLQDQGAKLDAEYEKTRKSRDKELGKLLNQIENMLNGRPIGDGSNSDEEKPETETEDKPAEG
jgi:hypothetical protein